MSLRSKLRVQDGGRSRLQASTGMVANFGDESPPQRRCLVSGVGAKSARAIQYAAATFVGSEKTHGAVERHHDRSEQIEPSPHLPNFDLGARRGAVHVFILKSAPI